MNTTTISSAVAGARGLLWISEAARDVDVEPEYMVWCGPRSVDRAHWRVQVAGRDALDRLGDRLGLGPVELEDGLALRYGEWADLGIELHTGAGR